MNIDIEIKMAIEVLKNHLPEDYDIIEYPKGGYDLAIRKGLAVLYMSIYTAEAIIREGNYSVIKYKIEEAEKNGKVQ